MGFAKEEENKLVAEGQVMNLEGDTVGLLRRAVCW
jgi:hypothetical protein